MNSSRFASFGLAVLAVLIESMAFAQVDSSNPLSALPPPVNELTSAEAESLRFTFVRGKYTSRAAFASLQVWATDWPEADLEFSRQLEATTGIPVDGNGLVLELTDSSLWSHPFLYLVEGGKLRLSDVEVAALRSYLDSGGFLLIDDFWGELEWLQLAAELDRVYPDLEPVALWPEHEIFESFFGIAEMPRAPGVAALRNGVDGENGASMDDANILGLISPSGRLVAVLCHNLDLGDAWEHVDDERYPREFSLGGLMLGINIVVYALTH